LRSQSPQAYKEKVKVKFTL